MIIGFLGILTLIAICLLYLATLDIPTLSPQGCRMSWMSPSYILQTGFNVSWTPLANRYSLWLYREEGWQPNHVRFRDMSVEPTLDPVGYAQASGAPVLFIPGNAGSSRQVRSIASSAVRQFFERPAVVAQAFDGGNMKPLDCFAGQSQFL